MRKWLRGTLTTTSDNEMVVTDLEEIVSKKLVIRS